MKTVNFSFTGGFPLDEDVMEFLQANWRDLMPSIFANAGTTPVIVSGMVSTLTGGTVTVTDGLFYSNGVLYPFTGATLALSPAPSVPCVLFNEDIGSLDFEDNSTNDCTSSKYGTLTIANPSSPAPGVIVVALTDFKQWHEIFGGYAKAGWQTITVTTTDYSGTVKYRKNNLTNTVQVKVSIDVASGNYYTVTGGPSNRIYEQVAALPAGCTPADDHYNIARVMGTVTGQDIVIQMGYPTDDPTTTPPSYPVENITVQVNSGGGVSLRFIPLDTTNSYRVLANFIFPLD